MDFISILATLGGSSATGFIHIIDIALLVWIIVVYLPKREKFHSEERKERDTHFLNIIDSYREALVNFQEKESEEHRGIVNVISKNTELLHEHDKHTLEANLKIARILDELQRG